MRSEAEIIRQIEAIRPKGTQHADWVLSSLGPYLSAAGWAKFRPAVYHTPLDYQRDQVVADLRMSVTNGIDAASSHHDRACRRHAFEVAMFAWALGDDWLMTYALSEGNWQLFGMPIFDLANSFYGFGLSPSLGLRNMAQGQACSALCQDGCL